ncbi:MAG: hypothetical protein BAJALOKI2v1_90073 [Promethearchaeota archaeon]|nr:MAG: hypothetical protein BAJALOKI2v1_90073 [Candidatus Lokiarchaeota archaeon]
MTEEEKTSNRKILGKVLFHSFSISGWIQWVIIIQVAMFNSNGTVLLNFNALNEMVFEFFLFYIILISLIAYAIYDFIKEIRIRLY